METRGKMSNIIFLHCVDMTKEAMKELRDTLSGIDPTKYTFIISDKEIKSIDKEELIKALKTWSVLNVILN